MKRIISLVSVALTTVFALSMEERYHNLPKVNVSDFEELKTRSPIDHFNYQGHESFFLRFWQNDKYFDKENGPIFFYLCGEYTCSIREDRLFPFMVGASHKARLVAIEHRYYGDSQPYKNWTTENLGYLNSEQALADFAHFM